MLLRRRSFNRFGSRVILFFGIFFRISSVLFSQIQTEFETGWSIDSAKNDFHNIYEKIHQDIYGQPIEKRIKYFRKAIKLFEVAGQSKDSLLGSAHVLLGLDLSHRNDYKEALTHFLEGLQHYRRAFSPDHYYVHSTYFHIAEKYLLNDNIVQAGIYCDSAIMYQWPYQKTKNWPRTTNLLARIYGAMGDQGRAEILLNITAPYRVLYSEEPESYYVLSIGRIYQDLNLPDSILKYCQSYYSQNPKSTEIGNMIGIAYLDLDKYDSAIHWYEELLKTTDKPEITLYNNLFHAYSHTGQANLALKHIHSIDTSKLNKSDLFSYRVNLAQTLADAGQLKDALSVDQSNEKILFKEEFNPAVEARYFANWTSHLLHYFRFNKDTSILLDNFETIRSAHIKIQKLRSALHSPTGRKNFIRICLRFYSNAIKIGYLIASGEKNSPWPSLILNMMESTKAMVLTEEFLTKRNTNTEELTYREKFMDFEGKIRSSQALFSQLEYSDSLFFWLQKERQSAASLLFIKDQQNQKPPANIVTYEFFVHPDSSLTVLQLRDQEPYQMHHLSDKEWLHLTNKVLIELRDPFQYDSLKTRLRELSVLLFPAQFNPVGDHLLIIPDGLLTNLPFEALQDQKNAYWVNHKNINYAFSLGLYNAEKTISSTGEKTYLFAPAFTMDAQMPGRSSAVTLKALRYNLEEVRQIDPLICNSEIFINESATKSNFKSHVANAKIIHLATHAIASRDGSVEPQIIFGKDEKEILSESELYLLKIPAEMVVMSACQTAIGRYDPGEGVMSFARAFTAAGSKSVVASLWAVNDATTAEIMTIFYTYLNKGMTKDQALQKAKKDYIASADPPYRHQYYWAGCIIIGDPVALDLKQNISFTIWLMLLSIVLVLFLFWKWKTILSLLT
ncbi:MAG: CHAT domain-containing protein [Saprospiraceae bacterium]|nr:CHAT domain-containing protein [Saprospiraceae bacterium]